MKGIKTNPAATNLKIILRQKIPSGESIDNFLFFFAGHGIINRELRDCLIPSDGEISIPDSLVTIDFVVDCLRDLHGIKNIVLVLDMCRGFSPPDRDSGMLGAETETLTKQKGIVTIFACQRNHKSYEIEDAEIRHGAFTYCLLQGLRQHTILKSLDVYLRRELPKLTQKYQQPQTPLIICGAVLQTR
ncbi:MAG: caspase family protein, partial [Coleofasciculaceae cyanobacterium SM2_1_6]|nr:caspase family protein [Coleofasciculaceae cyanobacterium SM2_1_6]